MKKVLWILLPLSLAIPTLAQEAAPALAASLSASQAASYTITERGPHHREWSRISWATNHQGQVVAVTNSAYTELSTGLNFYDAATGQWAESEARFEIASDGSAVARRGQHQVILAPNINATNAVDMQMPDGQRLKSRPLGLVLHDTASGTNVLIAELKDCAGQWLSPNVVIYPDAFDGLKAALRYTYTREGLEQDVVLYENPGSPAAYGLDPATTQLETWTEFFAPPTPRLTTVLARDGSEDERVEFTAMALGQGQAYFLDLANRVEPSLPVRKTWQQIGGRTFLVEAMSYAASKPLLDRLVAAPQGQDSRWAQKTVKSREELVAQFTRPPATQPKLVASITPGRMSEQSGLVLDYTTINSTQTNYVFKGDTTYYISGTVYLNGTTTFEGGTVIKYAPTNSASLTLNWAGVWQGTMYRPSVFTVRDDNTVGDTIPGSTGTPTNYYGYGLVVNYGGQKLSDVRFSHLTRAITLAFNDGQINVTNAQFVTCQYPLYALNQDNDYVFMDNALFCTNASVFYGGREHVFQGRHLTVNQSGNFFDSDAGSYCDICVTNSVLVGLSGWGNWGSIHTNGVAWLSATDGVFQTVGAASHYLADDTYRNAGVTGLGASLLASLKQRTTYPPVEVTTNFTGDTVLAPQATRDTDTPDLGYHYDPLDYVVSGRAVTNCTLTLTNGVALGTYGTNNSYGIYLRKGGNLISEGSATCLNRIVRYNTAQEQATTNWSASTAVPYYYYWSSIKVGSDTSPAPQGTFRFTGWSLLGGKGYHFYAISMGITTPMVFKDCQIGPGNFEASQCSLAFTNCLLERVYLEVADQCATLDVSAYNNLFRVGTLNLDREGDGTWQLKDNLFDQSTIYLQSGAVTHDYNGYVTNYSRLTPNGTNDVILTNNPVYQTGYLGRYYYPTNDGNLSRLIDAGSRTVDAAGLVGYTTQTNQVPDSCMVDIGFHYRGAGGSLTVSTNATPDQLARMLVPAWVTVANANYIGELVARGTFSGGGGCGLPIDSGVILASGDITNAIGPNDKSGKTTPFYTNGDTNLDDLVGGSGTGDAAVLEFDVVATNSFTLQFQYIFASEEYPEWIGQYNDPMAIFVSTNYDGTSWITSITNNLALVPRTTNVPVSVNTINGGWAQAGISATNAQYYVDNHDPNPSNSAMPPYSAATPVYNIQYDGTTTLLTAQILISANVTNHVKIAIADYGDVALDSAVFIGAQTPCP